MGRTEDGKIRQELAKIFAQKSLVLKADLKLRKGDATRLSKVQAKLMSFFSKIIILYILLGIWGLLSLL